MCLGSIDQHVIFHIGSQPLKILLGEQTFCCQFHKTDLQGGGGSALGCVLGGGHNAQIMNVHEFAIKFVVGRYRGGAWVDLKHGLRPGVDQGNHAVGQRSTLWV